MKDRPQTRAVRVIHTRRASQWGEHLSRSFRNGVDSNLDEEEVLRAGEACFLPWLGRISQARLLGTDFAEY